MHERVKIIGRFTLHPLALIIIVWMAVLSAIMLLTIPALAQEPPRPKCGQRIKIIYPLANQFLEAPLLEGIDEQGFRFELWANLDTGTWTVVTTAPGGPTCQAKAGNGFSILPLEPLGVPS